MSQLFDLEIEFTESFYRKTNPSNYSEALTETMQYMGNLIVEGLKDEAPVRTGRLRDGHYSIVEGNDILIGNDVEYAKYVIYGTSRQAPNNYPSRVLSKMGVFSEMSKSRFEESLITRGVL